MEGDSAHGECSIPTTSNLQYSQVNLRFCPPQHPRNECYDIRSRRGETCHRILNFFFKLSSDARSVMIYAIKVNTTNYLTKIYCSVYQYMEGASTSEQIDSISATIYIIPSGTLVMY